MVKWVILGTVCFLVISKEISSLNGLRKQIRSLQWEINENFKKINTLVYQKTTYLKNHFGSSSIIEDMDKLNKMFALEKTFNQKHSLYRRLAEQMSRIALKLITSPDFKQSEEFNFLTETFNHNVDSTNRLIKSYNQIVSVYINKFSRFPSGPISRIFAFKKYKLLS